VILRRKIIEFISRSLMCCSWKIKGKEKKEKGQVMHADITPSVDLFGESNINCPTKNIEPVVFSSVFYVKVTKCLFTLNNFNSNIEIINSV
jgi:hypothetical protein